MLLVCARLLPSVRPSLGFPIVCLLEVLRDRERGALDGHHPSREFLGRVARELDGGKDRVGDEELMDSQLKAVAEQLGFRASIKDGLADIAWTQGQTRREREQETPWLHSTTTTYPLIPHREFPTVVTD